MVKTRAKADLIRGLDDNQGLAGQLAVYAGALRRLARAVPLPSSGSSKVTKDDVMRVAKATFVPTNRTVGHDRERRSGEGREVRGDAAMIETLRDPADRSPASPAALARRSRRPPRSRRYTEIKYPPLPAFKVPQPETFTLKNGMRVFLMEDRELPLVSVRDARPHRRVLRAAGQDRPRPARPASCSGPAARRR